MKTTVLANTILESFLWLISAETQLHPPTWGHLYWDVSGQVTTSGGGGHNPTHQEVVALRPSEPTTTLAHGPVHQRAFDLAGYTSVPALATETPGPCSQRPWDLALPTSGLALALGLPPHQWAGTSP